MVLALNKSNLPLVKRYCAEILNDLPLHGDHIGIMMSARREIYFVCHHIYSTLGLNTDGSSGLKDDDTLKDELAIPRGVWEYL